MIFDLLARSSNGQIPISVLNKKYNYNILFTVINEMIRDKQIRLCGETIKQNSKRGWSVQLYSGHVVRYYDD